MIKLNSWGYVRLGVCLSTFFLFLIGCRDLPVESDLPTAVVILSPTPEPTITKAKVEPTDRIVGERTIGDLYIPELGNSGYDVQHYEIRLTLDPQKHFVMGDVTIEATIQIDQLIEWSYDFIGFEIEGIWVNDEPVSFTREGDKLIVISQRPFLVGEQMKTRIVYQGEPEERPSPYVGYTEYLGLTYPEDSETIYSLAEPDGARFWFPANDHPRDKATFEFLLTVPKEMIGIANGTLLQSQIVDEMGIFHWRHDAPMATYLAVVAVGRYEKLESKSVGGVPLRHYLFPAVEEEFTDAVSVTGEAIDWMSTLIVPYPYEQFGFVSVDVPGVSMETQTMVILSTQMLNERTVIHELMHMWFGNWVSLASWDEMWRNEGFATYFSYMWEYRDDPESFELVMLSIEEAVRDQGGDFPLNEPPPDQLFSFDSYFRGAWVIHQLRLEMGDESFFAGLQKYFQLYGGGVATDEQFQIVMEESAGFDLDSFFATHFQPLD